MNLRRILYPLVLLIVLAGCSSAQLPAAPPPTSPPATHTPTLLPPPTETIQPTEAPIEEPTATQITLPTETAAPEVSSSPPGIILFIGDGMGAGHRRAATWLVKGRDGVLAMDSLPVHGWAQTTNIDGGITDSAAAGTSISTGQNTYNGYVGVDAQQQTLTTILEMAKEAGWATGLVTTVPMAHATPAVFAAHYPDRSNYEEIARQMVGLGVDVLLGGGEDDFFGKGENGCFKGDGNQPNGGGLVGPAIQQGYTYVCTREELLSVNTSAGTQLLGLFAAEEMIAPFSPSLVEMTQTALAILSQDPDGFFLMVEAGQIDWAGHELDSEDAMQFTIGLDTAVTMAIIFTLARENTLLIVAADHETGGMSLNLDGEGTFRQDGPFEMPDGTPFWVDWEGTAHTSANIPVTAQGPYAEMLAGEYHLTHLFEVMSEFLRKSNQ